MAQCSIREYSGKHMLSQWLGNSELEEDKHQVHEEKIQSPLAYRLKVAQIHPGTVLETLTVSHPWLLNSKLVVKPDQLIKRRGKANLVLLNATWKEVVAWVSERRGKSITIEGLSSELTHFVIEPFLPHKQSDEYYVCILSLRDRDQILFHHEGGVDVGDVDSKATRMDIAIKEIPQPKEFEKALLSKIPDERKNILSVYLQKLLIFFRKLHFVYLEINPLVVTGKPLAVTPLDMAAKIDEAAGFLASRYWADLEFPPAFGKTESEEERYVASLDAKTGASLKLTLLNPEGRIWTMVAGGGASVVYADTICDYGYSKELSNYGEYSGAPTNSLTYSYARTILKLMTKKAHPNGKILFIGGGIANFTNIASTFKGIIRALEAFQNKLRDQKVQIYVRRGGPNYQEGLRDMREFQRKSQLDMKIFGPETHMTAIVALALGKPVPSLDFDDSKLIASIDPELRKQKLKSMDEEMEKYKQKEWFSDNTRAIVYGMQTKAVQNMLDFDYISHRTKPSVAAIVYTFTGNHFRMFYFGTKEIMIPVFQTTEEALKKNPDVSVVVNFASFRSVFNSTRDFFNYKQIKTVAIIAEGVPERHTRILIQEAKEKNINIIGPATVGGIKPAGFRIGNTGGMLDNIVTSKLYRPGSVGYVSRSGGLSNELNNVISRMTDGVFEGVAIGGDLYPGSTFVDHLVRLNDVPRVKMLVLLGEVGGTLEYEVIDAMKKGLITVPLVAWCTGTCSTEFSYSVQFGHAGARANAEMETAKAKNNALRAAGAFVPNNFDEFALLIHSTYVDLVKAGKIFPAYEVKPLQIPMDYNWAQKLGIVRKPASFISTISDERGNELCYNGIPISQIFSEDLGIGGVLGLLWFKKRLPKFASKFIEMVLIITADHGPAVSGAHNTIVAARAGKDLVSSLVSGLLTIGPRFGGALDEAARVFWKARKDGMSPSAFVSTMRKEKKLIQGIGHKVKSLENPDKRVSIVKDFAIKNFPSTDLLFYALEVEKITTKKSLI